MASATIVSISRKFFTRDGLSLKRGSLSRCSSFKALQKRSKMLCVEAAIEAHLPSLVA